MRSQGSRFGPPEKEGCYYASQRVLAFLLVPRRSRSLLLWGRRRLCIGYYEPPNNFVKTNRLGKKTGANRRFTQQSTSPMIHAGAFDQTQSGRSRRLTRHAPCPMSDPAAPLFWQLEVGKDTKAWGCLAIAVD